MQIISLIAASLMGLSTVACASGSYTHMKAPNKSPVIDQTLPLNAKVFESAFPGDESIRFARAYGDRATGSHGTFARFPPNFETPTHIHTHDYRAVVLKGEMTNPFKNEANPPILKPGSFWQVKGGNLHSTACVSDVPCEFYMYGDESFDFIPQDK